MPNSARLKKYKNELRSIFLSVSHFGFSEQCFNASCAIVAPYIVLDILRICNFLAYSAAPAHNHKTNDEMNGTQRFASHRTQNMCAKSAIQQWKWKWLRRQSLVNRICISSLCRAMCTAPSHLWSRKKKQNTMRRNDCGRHNCWASAELASA